MGRTAASTTQAVEMKVYSDSTGIALAVGTGAG